MAREVGGSGTGSIRVVATLADVPKESVSQDPLGFGPAAERLADIFAPALTVNTNRVRYYQAVVAGLQLAAESGSADVRRGVLELEKAWALSTYLSNRDVGDSPRSGLAGISYVRTAARPDNVRQRLDYQLFQRGSQAQQGMWGLYRRSATRLLLIEDDIPTGLGQRLAKGFVESIDSSLRRAFVGRTATATTAALALFGSRAGLFAPLDPTTAEAMWDALRADPNRRTSARTIRGVRGGQSELLTALRAVPPFQLSAQAALSLEVCFVGLIRHLDAAVETATIEGWVRPTEVRGNLVLKKALGQWQQRSRAVLEDLDRGGVDPSLVDLGRAVSQAADPWEALEVLVDRHVKIQEGKGRPPWLLRSGGRLVRGAATPAPGYKPLDPSSEPRGHDFRILNLKRLSSEVHAAGVKLR